MILVTGGAGVMGSRLVKRLAAEGHRVRALVLPGDPLVRHLHSCDDGCGCEVSFGDITDRASLGPAMSGVGTVFHLAAVIISRDPEVFRRVNVEGTRNVVASAAAAGVSHFVYVSSASVTYPNATDYSRSKREAEGIVRSQKAFDHTIVRPTLVYDRTGGQELEMFCRYLARFPVVPFVGNGRALKRPVHAGDIVDGLARIVGNEKARGKTYSFSGGEAISMIDLARLLIRQMRLSRLMVPVPEVMWRAALPLLGLLLGSRALAGQIVAGFTQDADLDNGPARTDLGYDPLPVGRGIPAYFHRPPATNVHPP
jgi:NADH dehydrogenase